MILPWSGAGPWAARVRHDLVSGHSVWAWFARGPRGEGVGKGHVDGDRHNKAAMRCAQGAAEAALLAWSAKNDVVAAELDVLAGLVESMRDVYEAPEIAATIRARKPNLV